MSKACKNVIWLQIINVITLNVISLIVPMLWAMIRGKNVQKEIMNFSGSAVAYLGVVVTSALPLILYYTANHMNIKDDVIKVNNKLRVHRIIEMSFILIALEIIGVIAYIGIENGMNILGLTLKGSSSSMSYSSTIQLQIVAVIIAPVIEEIVYRVIILNTFMEYNKVIAVIVSSMLFSMAHANVYQCTYTLLMGILLGIIAIRYGVRYTIVLHIINNAVSVGVDKMGEKAGVYALLIMTVIGVILLMVDIAKNIEENSEVKIGDYAREIKGCMMSKSFISMTVIWVMLICLGVHRL